MANSPLVVGQLDPIFQWTWVRDGGQTVDLTGATVTVTFTKNPDGTSRVGDGTMTITNNTNPATLTYAQSANDVAVAGTFTYRYKAVLASGKVIFSDRQELVIENP